MNIITNVFRRAGFAVAASAVALAALFPALSQLVSADQVSSRSIELSDSAPSHANTDYQFTFTAATNNVAQSLVVDFCSNSSIIGGTCTAPAGMNASTVTFTAGTNTTNWQLGTGGATQIRLTKNTGSALPNNSATTFVIHGITNPSATGTFWARIYTYSNGTYGNYDFPDSSGGHTGPGTYTDYGGFALSTASLINITATVMETLTFCVSGSPAPGAGCTSLSSPDVTLGHGTPLILDSSQVDDNSAAPDFIQVSTNAVSGVTVRMKTRNTCGGLSRNGGVDNCPIAANGSLGSIGAAQAKFGMHVTNVAGGTGTLQADPNYDGTTATNWGMGTTAGTNNVNDPYGTAIANTASAPTANTNAQLTFAAQAGVTTPAGVYSTAETLVATGTF